MKINERLEDILVWILVVFIVIAGYGLLDYLITSDWFYEVLKIIIPIGLASCVIYYQYKKFK